MSIELNVVPVSLKQGQFSLAITNLILQVSTNADIFLMFFNLKSPPIAGNLYSNDVQVRAFISAVSAHG